MNQPERVKVKDLFTELSAGFTIELTTDLSKDQQVEIKDITNIVRKLERGCFNLTIAEATAEGIDRLFTNPKFASRYSTITYKVASNLNITLLQQISDGVIDADLVAKMSSSELNPSCNETIRAQLKARFELKVPLKISNAHPCAKCGERRVTIQPFQGRSADEGESQAFNCVECGHSWKKM